VNRGAKRDPSINVAAGEDSYDVDVGRDTLNQLGVRLRSLLDARAVALITDDTVAALWGQQADVALARAGFRVYALRFPQGEQSKSWALVGELLENLARDGIERDDVVVALGGGVVGDVAGFAAASYLRGIDLVQVPTTLLAQVDSAIGGKTGIDLAAGKNLAGAFKPPRLVFSDTALLETLPDDEWRSGLAEVAKSAIISGEDFLSWLERAADSLLERDPEVVTDAVRRSAAFKAGVVSGDEREREGVRECLNYGHTFGHAIEKTAGYGVVPHGVAVAEGIRFAADLAADVVGADSEFVERQKTLLDRLGLTPLCVRWPARDLIAAMRSDKKARRGELRFVLARAPGTWECRPVDAATVIEHLEKWTRAEGSAER
jgi:3-dehydroquinate synthase